MSPVVEQPAKKQAVNTTAPIVNKNVPLTSEFLLYARDPVITVYSISKPARKQGVHVNREPHHVKRKIKMKNYKIETCEIYG